MKLLTSHMSPSEQTKFLASVESDPNKEQLKTDIRVLFDEWVRNPTQALLQWLSAELWISMPVENNENPVKQWEIIVWLWWKLPWGVKLWFEWSWKQGSQEFHTSLSRGLWSLNIILEHWVSLDHADRTTTDSVRLSWISVGEWTITSSLSQTSDGSRVINARLRWDGYSLQTENRNDGSYTHSVTIWNASVNDSFVDETKKPYLWLRQDYTMDEWNSYKMSAGWNLNNIPVNIQVWYNDQTWDTTGSITAINHHWDAKVTTKYNFSDKEWDRSEWGSIWVTTPISDSIHGKAKIEVMDGSKQFIAWIQGDMPWKDGATFSANLERSKEKKGISLGVEIPL